MTAENQKADHSLRRLGLALVVAAILTAGLWPGQAAPRNHISLTESGLHLAPASQAVTAPGLWANHSQFSLALWVTQTVPRAAGNLEIIGLWNEVGEPSLVLGQWPEGLYLHSRQHNPGALPELDRYARLLPDDAMRFVAMVGDSDGIRLSVDAETLPAAIPIDPARFDPRFGGRLLLGNARSDSSGFTGVIHAVAFFDRSLSNGELGRLATTAIEDLGSEAGLVALYRVSVGDKARIERHPGTAPKMLLPDRVSRPDPRIVNFKLSPRWHGPGLFWDVSINILGFVPLGLLIAWRRKSRGLLLAITVGLVLSLTIEVAQFWLPGRNSSGIDLCCNTLGAMLGGTISYLRSR